MNLLSNLAGLCAPDLWKRFTIRLRRLVAKRLDVSITRLSEPTVQYAKIAEYQLRSVVHFHTLIRLDAPRTADGTAPAPATLDAVALAGLIPPKRAPRCGSPSPESTPTIGPECWPSVGRSTPDPSGSAASPTT